MGDSKNSDSEKRQRSATLAQNQLKEEILQLQKELDSQKAIRVALEKALSCKPLLDDPTYKSLSKTSEDLIKEVALLEVEVVYLEQYLLSMYRRVFDQGLQALPKRTSNTACEADNLTSVNEEEKEEDLVSRCTTSSSTQYDSKEILGGDELIDCSTYQSHSSLSQNSACFVKGSHTFEALDDCHSLPLSMLERAQSSTSNVHPGKCLAFSLTNHIQETSNWLSEEMIKCISAVYCHLSDPPHESSSAPSWVNDPFDVDGSEELFGSFIPMVEVRGLHKDPQMLKSVQQLLHNYRSLISRLSRTDPGKLKHEEKLAFWINVHNSLVMHAFLVYGIPRGNMKRTSLVLKAAYNIGGHAVNVDTIQSSILRCRLPRPTQWLHSLLLRKTNFRNGVPAKLYSIKYPEPRLRFALSSGCQSDPPVRVYTATKVVDELEMAKEEYIQMNIKLHKESRLLLPKNVECFVKETGLCPSGMAEVVHHLLPGSWRSKLDPGKLGKKVDWTPHDFTFRVLIVNQMVSWMLNSQDLRA